MGTVADNRGFMNFWAVQPKRDEWYSMNARHETSLPPGADGPQHWRQLRLLHVLWAYRIWWWLRWDCYKSLIKITMKIFRFVTGVRKARSKVCRGGKEETWMREIQTLTGMSATLSYFRSVMESGIRCCNTIQKVQVGQWEIKTRKLILPDSFLGLSANSGLQVISCLSAPNVLIAGAKHGQNSGTNSEIWPESPRVTGVT